MGCTGRSLGSLQRVPEPAASGEIGFPESSTPLQFRGLPERAFGRTPSRIGKRHWWKSLVEAHQSLHISHTQVLDEYTQAPAIGDGMMNREDQNVLIGAPPKDIDAVKGSTNCIECLAEDLFRQLFDRLFVPLRRGKLAETEIDFAALTNHLHRSVFARQERKAQNLLPFHHSQKRSLAGLLRDDASQLNEAAYMVRAIRNTNGRCLP